MEELNALEKSFLTLQLRELLKSEDSTEPGRIIINSILSKIE